MKAAATDPSDAELLQQFVASRDEAAFAALVGRHGPTVLGICRRMLHNINDADDAFQMTFLLLATSAKRVREPLLLGNWLFGTATRVALNARRAARRRVIQEQIAMGIRRKSSFDVTKNVDLKIMLDEQISRLPEKLKRVVICCYLDGFTKHEAARRLNISDSTVVQRLKQARETLKRRLSTGGGQITEASLGSILAPVAVPIALSASTVKAATLAASGKLAAGGVASGKAGLSKGAIHTLLPAKIKVAAVFLAATTLAVAGTAMVLEPGSDSQSPVSATMPAMPTQAAPTTRNGKFSSRMRDVIFAILMYSSQHRQELPADLSIIKVDSAGIDYLGQAKVRLGGIPTPHKVAIIAETPTPGSNDRIYVGFFDGHVAQLTQAEARKTIEESRRVIQFQASGTRSSSTQPLDAALADARSVDDPSLNVPSVGASTGVLAHVPSADSAPMETSPWRWIVMLAVFLAMLAVMAWGWRKYGHKSAPYSR